MLRFLVLFFLAVNIRAFAAASPKVEADFNEYRRVVAEKNRKFSELTPAPAQKEWAVKKLAHMVDVDQYMRKLMMEIPREHNYTEEETQELRVRLVPEFAHIDGSNTKDLKLLLKIHQWFKISVFGQQADKDAWLLVQHADHDPDFQREVLGILETLLATKNTTPSNYAYLSDRVAASYSNPTKRIPQKFGTQGSCVAKGKWEPLPIAAPVNELEKRRAEFGLETHAAYVARLNVICA